MNVKRILKILAIASLLLLVIAVPVAADTVIVHTTDVHGRLNTNIGYDGLAAYINDLKAAGDTVLLFDAGDAFQGLADVNYFNGESAADIMNELGYLAMAPGNHDFDFGVDNLVNLSKKLKFPILCINVLDETGKTLFETSKIIEADGMKIGVFGVIAPITKVLEGPMEGMNKLTFLEGEDLYNAAQNEVDSLKKQGCDFIICLSHLGMGDNVIPNRSSDLASNVTRIDLIIDGHDHIELPEGKMVGSTLIVNTGKDLKYIGVVRIVDGKPTASLVSYKDYTKKDSKITNLIQEWTEELNKDLSKVIGTTLIDLNGESKYSRTQETNLGDLVTDALMWYQEKEGYHADCSLINGGGIRESIPAGDITLKAVNTVHPFGNSLVVMKITGEQLLKAFEDNTATVPNKEAGFPQVSGIVYTLDTTKPYVSGEINRVTIKSVNGKPFNVSDTYSVATTDYIADGGDKYSAFAGSEYVDLGITTDSVLDEYIISALNGKIGEEYAKPQGRITVIGSSSSSDTQAATTETSTAKSPVGVFGILAGLGIAGVLVTRRH